MATTQDGTPGPHYKTALTNASEPDPARESLNRFDLLEHDIQLHGEAAARHIRAHTRRLDALKTDLRRLRVIGLAIALVLLIAVGLTAGIAIQAKLH